MTMEISISKRALLILHTLAVGIYLFQKTQTEEEAIDQALEEDEESNNFNRIRCPVCYWPPSEWSQWCCGRCEYPEQFFGGCGTSWNTFETHGRCPGCNHQWIWTVCLRCHRWSLHEEWYTTQENGKS